MSALSTSEGAPDAAAEERARLGVSAASLPITLLAAPCFLPIAPGRSLLESGHYRPEAIATLIGLFAWPVLVGVVGFVRALQRRPPGKVAFGVPSLAVGGFAVLGAGAIAMAFLGNGHPRADELPMIIAAFVAWIGALAMIVRGLVRAGWQRWIQLVAAVWLVYAGALILMSAGRSRSLAAPPGGIWAVIFGLSAAAASLGWGMRRKHA